MGQNAHALLENPTILWCPQSNGVVTVSESSHCNPLFKGKTAPQSPDTPTNHPNPLIRGVFSTVIIVALNELSIDYMEEFF